MKPLQPKRHQTLKGPASPQTPEGVYAPKSTGRPSAKVGRPRGKRSMGRFPFLAFARQYLGRRKPNLSPVTLKIQERRARYLNKVLTTLRNEGKISTTNPSKMTSEDVTAFIIWMRDRKLKNSSIAKSITLLGQVCAFAGNSVLTKMKAQGEELPKRIPKDLRALTEGELAYILQATDGLTGWNGEVSKFIMNILPYTGLRASELRLAHIEDIDTMNWVMWVRHPKGELRYARQRAVPILFPAREAVKAYLEARERHLKEYGVSECEALIPVYHDGKFGFYSDNSFRKMKEKVEERVNQSLGGRKLSFQLRTFRDTYCQMNIDLDKTSLPDVSVSMGHSTTRTTELHYGRLKNSQAVSNLNRVWEQRATKTATPTISQNVAQTPRENEQDQAEESGAKNL